MWQKMRHRSHSAKFLTYLRELCAWRENRAINKNVPRQSFIKDDLLLNICSDCPTSKEDLCKVRGMRDDLAMGKIGDEIIAFESALKNYRSTTQNRLAYYCLRRRTKRILS